MIYSGVFLKNNKDFKEIEINHLIVLCELGKDYKSFCNDLEELIKSKSAKDLVSKVYHAMRKKSFFIPNKYKKFIEKHKHTIEIMNKYSCLSNLTILSYDEKGNRKKNLAEDYFYQYIQEHKEDIETIKAVALKIKALGFVIIEFEEKLDFTKQEYELNNLYDLYENHFVFLENMEVIPTYSHSPIKYRTKSSSYRMILYTVGHGNNKRVQDYGTIELNSLIFDPNKLPNEITIESTIGLIKKLAQKKKEEYDDIHNSVDLSIATSNLKDNVQNFKTTTERIDKIKDNEELMNLINQMQNILTQLQLFDVDFENQIIDSHTDITDETMKKEKGKCLEKKKISSNIGN